ncbi:MAG TPA: ShlB/FhaC/HecB family hemolysin secretion/activation protein [Geminicoccaceae bacterium]
MLELTLATAALIMLGCAPAAAQLPDQVPGRLAPSERRPELPAPPREGPPPLVVPQPPPARPGAPGGLRVWISQIEIVGAELIDRDRLEAAVAGYAGRFLSIDELIALRDVITRLYVDQGYVNSGAIIPQQDVSDGVIVIQVIEGRLGEIQVEGLRHLRASFVEERIRAATGPVLNVERVREQLLLLLREPLIERLQATLLPGPTLGDSRLLVEAEEAQLATVTTDLSNDRPPAVGAEEAEVLLTLRSTSGRADPLRLSVAATEGLRTAYFDYSVPLTAGDLRFNLAGQAQTSEIVEEPLDELDIEGESYTLDIGLSAPLVNRSNEQLLASMTLSRRHSETKALGRSFSFAPGVDDGEADITAIRLAQEWRRSWSAARSTSAIAARSTFSLGLDALGATINDEGPDSQFLTWLGQVQWAVRDESTGNQLRLRGDLQLAAEGLLPIERIGIGGLRSVRGYRENRLVRDSGWIVSIEYDLPLVRLPVPRLSAGPDDGFLRLAPFIDAGGGWNVGTETPNPDAIYGAGAGLVWTVSPRLEFRVDAALPLQDVDDLGEEDDLQDRGLYFQVRAQLY